MNDADRELIELAARAAGHKVKGWINGRLIGWDAITGNEFAYWNPLEDDGDAFRLMVDCNLGVSIPPMANKMIDVCTFTGPVISIREAGPKACRRALARRAIVRAAAEIGRGME